ncbi:MAG: tetratricopeptide repeat protein [Bryobacteraceae bacterium]
MKLACVLIFAAVQLFAQDPIFDGKRALENGRPLDAIRSFRMALAARPDGDSSGSLHPLLIGLATAYLDAGDLHGAEVTLVEASRNAPPDPLSKAELENDWGSLLLKMGRLNESTDRFTHAMELLSVNRAGNELAPAVLNNLAATEIRLGRYNQALGHQKEALAMWTSFESADNADLIKGRASLASLEFLVGRPEDARHSMDLAIASARRTYGPNSGTLGDLLESQAVILKKLGLKKEAKSAQAEARRIGKEQPKRAAPQTWDAQEALVEPSSVHVVSK